MAKAFDENGNVIKNKDGTDLHIKDPALPISPADFPQAGLVRLSELATHSGHLGYFPLSPKTWERAVEKKKYPSAQMLHGIRFWKAEDVREVVDTGTWSGAEA